MEGGKARYLECEKRWVFFALMLVGGYYGGFTYLLRGGVFCNGQTGNFVRFGLALGAGQWGEALYHLVPLTAYIAGTVISEAVAKPIKRLCRIRWETLLIAVEILFVLVLGLLPESALFQISQIMVNLVCAMQYNTFRQAEGVSMSTTFCTNHVRQTGVFLARAVLARDRAYVRLMCLHAGMLAVFVTGVVLATVLGSWLRGKCILFLLLPLGTVLGALASADLGRERDKLDISPHGHT